MNVCILKESLNIGGTERSAANISKVLSKDHRVFMALYDASQIKYHYAGQLVDFHLAPKPSIIGKVINTFFRNVKLKRLLKNNNIDILYTFTGVGNRQTHYSYNTVKIISARDFGGMYELHSQYKAALDHSSAMICNSEYTKRFYLSKYPADVDKVFALYNYIDIFEIQKQSNEATECDYDDFLIAHPNTIVSVGRFCKEKGFEYLIEAFASAREHLDNMGLIFVGDGDYKQQYEQRISQLGIRDHVYFTGFQKNPYKYMKKCSCFVLSSLSEGFPNVLAEAMALGLPVIADNCFSGPAEILRKDQDYESVKEQYQECDYGILTPRITLEENANAIMQLSEAIHHLLSDEDKMLHYKTMSFRRAEDFSEDSARTKLNDIFRQLLERRAAK